MRPPLALPLLLALALAGCDAGMDAPEKPVPVIPVPILPGQTCADVQAFHFDPLPLRTGQTWGFALKSSFHSESPAREARDTNTTGTVTWTVEAASCVGGTVTAKLSERQVSVTTDTLKIYRDPGLTVTASRKDVDVTTRHEVTFSRNGPFPKVGAFVGNTFGEFKDPVPYFVPPSGMPEGTFGVGEGRDGGGREFWTWKMRADATGLRFWEAGRSEYHHQARRIILLQLERLY